MEATDYKARCNQPDVMSRNQIEASSRVLSQTHPHLSAQIIALLSTEPISKPEQHQGGTQTDYFVVSVSLELAEEVADAMLIAEAEAVSHEGETTAQASFIGDLVDAWHRYSVAV